MSSSDALALREPELVRSVRTYAADSLSPRTREAYRKQTEAFSAWCRERNLAPFPATPELIAVYLADRADHGCKVATLAQAMAAIGLAHRMAGHDDPCRSPQIREVVWKGIRRRLGTAQTQKAPLSVRDLREMSGELADKLIDARDRALLLLGFAGAFRRSELIALRAEDLTFTEDGLIILIRRSKTDQEGKGRKVGIPNGRGSTCPVRAVREWTAGGQITEGPLFRAVDRHGNVSPDPLTGRSVARIVKRTAQKIGLDPEIFSGHSLRAGLVTAAAKAGRPVHAIMAQTGHKSVGMVQRYIRDVGLFDDNAAAGIGL